MALRYLILLGELPGEGVWCSAATHDELVQCIWNAWGSDFDPIFKYIMPTSVAGGEEAMRYEDVSSPFRYTEDNKPRHPAMATAAAAEDERNSSQMNGTRSTQKAPARRGVCYVILNDEADFQLWLHGARAAASVTTHTVFDPLHNAIYHADERPSSSCTPKPVAVTGVESSRGDPLTRKLFAFRKTATAPRSAVRISHAAVAAEDAVNLVAKDMQTSLPSCHGSTYAATSVRTTQTVTASLHRSSEGNFIVADNVLVSAHPYYHTTTTSNDVFVPRSSPAVKSARLDCADIVRPPTHTLLDSFILLKLGVRVVLRHSNATEVLLVAPANVPGAHSAPTVATHLYGAVGEGCGGWGELIARARSAWGVHRPVFRYLDLSQGYMQMTIHSVQDYRMWAEGVGRVNPELLVLEQDVQLCMSMITLTATTATKSAPATVAETVTAQGMHSAEQRTSRERAEWDVDNVERYCAAQSPPEIRVDADLHAGTHLRSLVERLAILEREELQKRVGRPVPYPTRALPAGSPKESPHLTFGHTVDTSMSSAIAQQRPLPFDVTATLQGSAAGVSKPASALQQYEEMERRLLSCVRQRHDHASSDAVVVAKASTTRAAATKAERHVTTHADVAVDSSRAASRLPTEAAMTVATGTSLYSGTPTQFSQEVAHITRSIASGAFGPPYSVKGSLSSPAAPSGLFSEKAAQQAQQAAAAEHQQKLAAFLQFQHHRQDV